MLPLALFTRKLRHITLVESRPSKDRLFTLILTVNERRLVLPKFQFYNSLKTGDNEVLIGVANDFYGSPG